MSYRCPKCNASVFDRTNYLCPVCGTDLPPELLFRPPDWPGFDDLAQGKDIQVALLAQALLELRKAKARQPAQREAVIRYFKNGISSGFTIPDLITWLFLWPDNRWCVFAQMGLSENAGHEFLNMVKALTLRDLGVDDSSPAAQPE